MANSRGQNTQQVFSGSLRVLAAEALIFPAGLMTAAVLSRRLGQDGYGLFALAVTIVAWIEWSVTSIFARATIKLISEADDWEPIGATVVRIHLAVGVASALLLAALAGPIAAALEVPQLASCLRLFAIDLPIFSLAQANRNILVGIGAYGQRARAAAGRWITRLLLIVVLVEAGLSLTGAILGSIGASLVELALARRRADPLWPRRSSFPVAQLCGWAMPLFLYALSVRLFEKMDLFALKALGGTVAEAGIYGAAQNLALVPGLIAMSFSPLLLSSMSRLRKDDGEAPAQQLAHDSLRAVVAALPFAAMIAGAAPEIVTAVYGADFAPAAPLLARLIFSGLALVLLSVAAAILIAVDRPGWTFALAGPMVPVAILGYLVVIPRLGAPGAAMVTTVVACFGSLAQVLAVHRVWGILPPAGTFWRGIAACIGAYAISVSWIAPGWLLLIKLPTIVIFIMIAYLLMGEFGAGEISRGLTLLRGTAVPSRLPSEPQ
jgi:O-antigen/teichoic acid export membrane protein